MNITKLLFVQELLQLVKHGEAFLKKSGFLVKHGETFLEKSDSLLVAKLLGVNLLVFRFQDINLKLLNMRLCRNFLGLCARCSCLWNLSFSKIFQQT